MIRYEVEGSKILEEVQVRSWMSLYDVGRRGAQRAEPGSARAGETDGETDG